jgi:hypothetical protein
MKKHSKSILSFVKRYSLREERNSMPRNREQWMRNIKSSLRQLKPNYHIIKLTRNSMLNGRFTQLSLEPLYNQLKLEKLLKEFLMIGLSASTADVNLQLFQPKGISHFVLRRQLICKINLKISKRSKDQSKHSKLGNQQF